MRHTLSLLLLTLLPMTEGCGKGTATAQHQPTNPAPPTPTSRSQSSSSWMESASGVPGQAVELTQAPGEIQVEIEGAERELPAPAAGRATSGSYLLAVKVKVTSRREKPLPLVEPRRFTIETDEGQKLSPRMSGRKEPTLGTTYLKIGTSVGGWLTFDVPEKAKNLILKADFEQPPLSLPVPHPKSPRDS